MRDDEHRYDDIINMPHHVSARRPQMSTLGRAAQFAPFAALTGYDAAVNETARLTERCVELDEESQRLLSERLRAMLEAIAQRPEVTITYFEPDAKKAGGVYLSVTGRIRRIDEVKRELILTDRTVIPMERIFGIDGDLFR